MSAASCRHSPSTITAGNTGVAIGRQTNRSSPNFKLTPGYLQEYRRSLAVAHVFLAS